MNRSPKLSPSTRSYHPPTNPNKQREAVLIVLHSDGWVEAFAERHVDCKLVVMPSATTAAGQIAAEELLAASLPWRYRNLYWPGSRRAAGLVRTITPTDLEHINWNVEFVETLNRIGKEFQAGDAMEATQTWIA